MVIQKEVKHAIKHAVPEAKLIRFHFTFHETQQLTWVKSHEFILNGHYYDVIHKAKDKNGYFFKCISDDQETALFQQLKSMTSFNLSHSGKDQPVNVWFKFLSEPMEVLQSIEIDYGQVVTQVSSVLTSYEEWSYSSCLSTETPPPDFIS
ncbi:MAG: hypothetical protein WCH03_07085 [Flavobacteriia bacterium]